MPGFGFTPFGRRPFSTIIDLPLPATVASNAIANGAVFTVEVFPVVPVLGNLISNTTGQGAVVGTPGTMPNNWAWYANGGLSQSVVGTGTSSGRNYVDLRLSGTSTYGFAVLSMEGVGAAASAGQALTETIYAAIVGGSVTNISSIYSQIQQVGGAQPAFTANFSTLTATLVAQPSAAGTLTDSATAAVPEVVIIFPVGVAIDITLRLSPQMTVVATVLPTIRVATEEFATRDTDSLPSMPFSGTLENALRFHRAIIDGSKIGGMASGYADIVINNPSGEYDAYANSLDGATVIVRMGQRGASFDSFVPLCTSLVDGSATIDEETLTLHLYDDNKRLEIPVQPHVYGGTGGIDGDANCKGKRVPLCLGTPPNITLQLIDAANLVYQAHDGAMGGWAHIYDRGIELPANATPDYANYAALTGATITAGRYASCLALGIVRLGAKPDGTVTGTPSSGAVSNGIVAGKAAGAALTDTASLMHYLLTISTANVVVDIGSVLALAAAQPAPIGYFVGPDDSKTLRQALDELSNGILGWAGFRRDRTFDMGLIALPGSIYLGLPGQPAASYLGDYTGQDFFTLTQLPLPSGMSPPPWRIRAAYSLNWTQQADIDATVDASTQTLRKDPYSIAVSSNSTLSTTIQAAHPQAQDIDVWPSYFVNSSDAVAFCNSVLTLFGGATRGLYEITLQADAYALNLNNPIRVTDDRYGLSGGKLLTIVSIDDDTTNEQAIVQGFG